MILLFLSNFRLVQVHKFLFSYRYSQFLDFITFLQNKDIRYSFKQRLHIEDTARLGQAVARWVFFQGYLAGQGIVRAVHGRQYWKMSPNGKMRKSYEEERARFPIGYQRFSKGCRATYFLLPWTSFLTLSNSVST